MTSYCDSTDVIMSVKRFNLGHFLVNDFLYSRSITGLLFLNRNVLCGPFYLGLIPGLCIRNFMLNKNIYDFLFNIAIYQYLKR